MICSSGGHLPDEKKRVIIVAETDRRGRLGHAPEGNLSSFIPPLSVSRVSSSFPPAVICLTSLLFLFPDADHMKPWILTVLVRRNASILSGGHIQGLTSSSRRRFCGQAQLSLHFCYYIRFCDNCICQAVRRWVTCLMTAEFITKIFQVILYNVGYLHSSPMLGNNTQKTIVGWKTPTTYPWPVHSL